MSVSLVDVERVPSGVRYDYVFVLRKFFRSQHYRLSFTGDTAHVWFNDVWEGLKRTMDSQNCSIEDLIEIGSPTQIDIGVVEFSRLSPQETRTLAGSKARQQELLDRATDKVMRIRQEMETESPS